MILLTPIFESQKLLRAASSTTMEGFTFCYYQCYNVKCMYVLTGHGNQNRLKKLFLLCKCHKGKAARDINHLCTFILDNKQELLYDKAKNQWKKHQENPNYTEAEHCKWMAHNNDGVSNFGLHPSLLPRSSIRPNVFYLGCSIGIILITYLRSFAVRQSELF